MKFKRTNSIISLLFILIILITFLLFFQNKSSIKYNLVNIESVPFKFKTTGEWTTQLENNDVVGDSYYKKLKVQHNNDFKIVFTIQKYKAVDLEKCNATGGCPVPITLPFKSEDEILTFTNINNIKLARPKKLILPHLLEEFGFNSARETYVCNINDDISSTTKFIGVLLCEFRFADVDKLRISYVLVEKSI